VFGDLDVSVLDELPPSRQPIKSRWFPADKLEPAYEFIRKHIVAGEQAFVVYPLVEESEALDLKAATSSARFLQKRSLPRIPSGCPARTDAAGRERARDGGIPAPVAIIFSFQRSSSRWGLTSPTRR